MAQQHDYYRIAYTYVNNEADALDALENIIVILYEKIEQLNEPAAFQSQSKTILVNECRAIIKKRNKIEFLADFDVEEMEQLNEMTELGLDLEQSMQRLLVVQREAIQMNYQVLTYYGQQFFAYDFGGIQLVADGKLLDWMSSRYKRTLLFKTNEEALRLFVGGVYYQKAYNKKIEIDL